MVLESICLPVAHGHALPCVTDPETSHLKAIMASSRFSHSRKRPGRAVILPRLWLNSDKPQGFCAHFPTELMGPLAGERELAHVHQKTTISENGA